MNFPFYIYIIALLLITILLNTFISIGFNIYQNRISKKIHQNFNVSTFKNIKGYIESTNGLGFNLSYYYFDIVINNDFIILFPTVRIFKLKLLKQPIIALSKNTNFLLPLQFRQIEKIENGKNGRLFIYFQRKLAFSTLKLVLTLEDFPQLLKDEIEMHI